MKRIKKIKDLKFSNHNKKNNYKYLLLEKGFSKKDLDSGIKILKSGKITMNNETRNFENKFAKKLKVKYAVMTNSGSSANLLATYAANNPLRINKFKRGDEAIVPALCWPTSLWPLYQTGLKIKFVDVDPKTLNVDAENLISAITKKTKVIMLVNVLGISSNIKKISDIAKKKNLIVLEDNCEALGAKLNNKYLGTFGDFGTFSFFYSHQITSGEGGMIVCHNKRDYEILLSLRSHGWSRSNDIKQYTKVAKKYPKLDPRYIFINQGFNLRPTDVQAAMGLSQFKKLEKLIKIRTNNREEIIKSLKKDYRWKNQFNFVKVPKNIFPSYMGLPILLDKKMTKKIKKDLLIHLESNGVETRPILTGNFLNQPSIKLFNLHKQSSSFKGAQVIEDLGFLIGLHTKKISKKYIDLIKNSLFYINKLTKDS
jgi:CDP-6-deoxy-D-xylo-4-hexulose-3-dehydrase